MTTDQTPFSELPAALVEEVLGQATSAGELLLKSFRHIKTSRDNFRNALIDKKVILNESIFGYPPLPTTCATDGSYAIERLLTTDLIAAAAVAIEGLTPPSEKRYWEAPHHSTFIAAEVHHAETATILRAVMLGNELLLAVKAPHDLVMIDGTLTLPIIYFNQALNLAPNSKSLHCSKEFLKCCSDYLEAYLDILESSRSDKNFVGLPKYSTRREIGRLMQWPGEYDDRGLLTLILQPGELTQPFKMEQPAQEWHLNVSRLPQDIRSKAKKISEEIITHLKTTNVLYYKPHDWLPALRIELSNNIASNSHRLASVIQGLKYQCATSSMLEPYPIYLADRTVKALAHAVPAFRHVTTQRISEQYEGEIGDVFFAMHGYRSEAGG